MNNLTSYQIVGLILSMEVTSSDISEERWKTAEPRRLKFYGKMITKGALELVQAWGYSWGAGETFQST